MLSKLPKSEQSGTVQKLWPNRFRPADLFAGRAVHLHDRSGLPADPPAAALLPGHQNR
jgi:hypothetical protein